MNTNSIPAGQAKLEQGLEKLKQTSPEDTAGMGTTLTLLHGAMEDFVRSALAQKAPHLRAAAEDPQTNWQDLLEHGRRVLGFSEYDCTLLTEGAAQREAAAKGRGFTYTYTDLVNYSQFVRQWVRGSAVGTQSAPDPWRGQEQAEDPVASEPGRPWDDRAYLFDRPKPWYRSTLVLFLLFFLLPPLWAILILTNPGQNGLLRGLAALEIAILFFLCAYMFLPMPSLYSNAIDNVWQMMSGAATPTQALATIPTLPAVVASPPSFELAVPTSAGGACSVVWVETPGDELAGKNRSMAWEDVIQAKVEGSGMTSNEFYDLVVEHNPQFAADGYVFQEGKIYSMPQCGE